MKTQERNTREEYPREQEIESQQNPVLPISTSLKITVKVVLLASILLFGGPALLIAGSILTNRTAPASRVQPVICLNEDTHQKVSFPLAVASPLKVVVTNDIGTIHTFHITGGSASDKVTFTSTAWDENTGGEALPYCILSPLSPHGNMLTINGDSINAALVDFDLTIPKTFESTALNLTTRNGDIAVMGITGPMHLQSDSGSIEVTARSLGGDSLLTTNSGSLVFNGTLDPGAIYKFETSRGGIDVALPSDAAFQLDAQNGIGMIATDFPGISVRRSGPQDIEAQAVVGNPPINSTRAHLILRSNLGAINLHMD
jgi:hypothetical protein